MGTSRKSFIALRLEKPDPKQRVWGTATIYSTAIAAGADIMPVHDVDEMTQISRASNVLWRSG